MSARYHPQRVYDGIKSRFRELADKCGGPNQAARISRVSQQQISRCSSHDDEHERRFPPTDVVADLESHCGKPIVTEYLAELAGYVLVPVPAPSGDDALDLVARVSDMLAEVSDVSGGVALALADNEVSTREARGLHREVRQALQKLVDLDSAITRAAQRRPETEDEE